MEDWHRLVEVGRVEHGEQVEADGPEVEGGLDDLAELAAQGQAEEELPHPFWINKIVPVSGLISSWVAIRGGLVRSTHTLTTMRMSDSPSAIV
jgi:hypothetical protein